MTHRNVTLIALILLSLASITPVLGGDLQELILPIVTTAPLSPTRFYTSTILLQNTTAEDLEVTLAGFSGIELSEEQTSVNVEPGKLVRIPINRGPSVISGWVKITYSRTPSGLQVSCELSLLSGETTSGDLRFEVIPPERIISRAVLPALEPSSEVWTSAKWDNDLNTSSVDPITSGYTFVNPSERAVAHVKVLVSWLTATQTCSGILTNEVELSREMEVPPLQGVSRLFFSGRFLGPFEESVELFGSASLGFRISPLPCLVPPSAKYFGHGSVRIISDTPIVAGALEVHFPEGRFVGLPVTSDSGPGQPVN